MEREARQGMKWTRLPGWLIGINVLFAILGLGMFMADMQKAYGVISRPTYLVIGAYVAWTWGSSLWFVFKRSDK